VARYVGLNEVGEEVSEHVSFHRALKQQGYRLFINPKMINASYTDHTEHLHFLNRLRRKSKNLIGSVIKAVIGEKWFGQLKRQ
jgi:hypothetical protein